MLTFGVELQVFVCFTCQWDEAPRQIIHKNLKKFPEAGLSLHIVLYDMHASTNTHHIEQAFMCVCVSFFLTSIWYCLYVITGVSSSLEWLALLPQGGWRGRCSVSVCVCVCYNTHTRSDRLMIMLDQCQTNRRSEHFEKEYLALGLFQAVLVFFTERSGLFSSPTSEKSLLFDLFL